MEEMKPKPYRKMNYHADAETVAAIAILKEYQVSISGLVQVAIKEKAREIKILSELKAKEQANG